MLNYFIMQSIVRAWCCSFWLQRTPGWGSQSVCAAYTTVIFLPFLFEDYIWCCIVSNNLNKIQVHKAEVQMVLMEFWSFLRESLKIYLVSRTEIHHCSLKRCRKCIIAEIWKLDSKPNEVARRFSGWLTEMGWLSICWAI